MIYIGNKKRVPRVRKTLTAHRLKEVFDYDRATGVFIRRIRTAQRVRAGELAGCINSRGCLSMRVDGKLYLAHRLAWLYVTGEWPTQHIDHRDGNPSNNAFANLRDVAPLINAQNIRRARVDSSIGLIGVGRSGSKFRADIQANRKTRYLGTFDTAEAAHQAYLSAKRELHEGNML